MEKKYFYEMDSKKLNGISLLLLLIIVIITIVVGKLLNYSYDMDNFQFWVTSLLFIPYFIFHEILHSIGYVVNGAKFKNITYGMHLEKGILCCSCKQEIPKKCILWSLMYPFLFIGVITYIIGIIFNIQPLILLSIANISGCSGDLIMFFAFLKLKNFRFFEYDNPIAFGIVTEEDMENKKMYALKRIEENNFKQTIGKKITISKTSLVLSIIYLILCIINMYL